jgi:antitoxin component of MazEF toxin-antitoxin module
MSNRVKVQQLPQGQFTVSIPRALAQALGITKGQEMVWVLVDGELTLKRAEL